MLSFSKTCGIDKKTFVAYISGYKNDTKKTCCKKHRERTWWTSIAKVFYDLSWRGGEEKSSTWDRGRGRLCVFGNQVGTARMILLIYFVGLSLIVCFSCFKFPSNPAKSSRILFKISLKKFSLLCRLFFFFFSCNNLLLIIGMQFSWLINSQMF